MPFGLSNVGDLSYWAQLAQQQPPQGEPAQPLPPVRAPAPRRIQLQPQPGAVTDAQTGQDVGVPNVSREQALGLLGFQPGAGADPTRGPVPATGPPQGPAPLRAQPGATGPARGDTSYGFEPNVYGRDLNSLPEGVYGTLPDGRHVQGGDAAAQGLMAMSGNPGLVNQAADRYFWQHYQPGQSLDRGASNAAFAQMLGLAQRSAEQGRKQFETTGDLGIRGRQTDIAQQQANSQDLLGRGNLEVAQEGAKLNRSKFKSDQDVTNLTLRGLAVMAQNGATQAQQEQFAEMMRNQAAQLTGRQDEVPLQFGVNPGTNLPNLGVSGPVRPVGVAPAAPGAPVGPAAPVPPGTGRGTPAIDRFKQLLGTGVSRNLEEIQKGPGSDADKLTKAALAMHRELGDEGTARNLDAFLGELRKRYGEPAVNNFVNPSAGSMLGSRIGNIFSAPSQESVLASQIRNAQGRQAPALIRGLDLANQEKIPGTNIKMGDIGQLGISGTPLAPLVFKRRFLDNY